MQKENYIPVEQLLSSSQGSLYRLAILVAKRALQLAEGEKALVDRKEEKTLEIAVDEIAAGKIKSRPVKEEKE